MASEKNLNAVFTDIANAIREKKGTTDQIKPINMADEIMNLPSGSGGIIKPETIELSVIQNGIYIPDGGKTYSKVSVNVPQKEAIELSVIENGIYVPGEGKSYSKVSVRVPQTVGNLSTTELSITQNGIYLPDEGAAYSKISVNVPQTAESGTVKALLDAKKSCRYLFKDYTGTSVDGLISYSDTSNVTEMSDMFSGCSSLTTIPQLDTSSATYMTNMFDGCSSLATIPQLDTSKVTTMSGMFWNCVKLITIPELNTSSVTDTSNMFAGCSSLTTIPQLDTSSVTYMYNMFSSCSSLKSILMTGMQASFNISSSTQFEESDLVTILNNLATVPSKRTLTMGSTNLAKLTDEEKAIATNKGWTLK